MAQQQQHQVELGGPGAVDLWEQGDDAHRPKGKRDYPWLRRSDPPQAKAGDHPHINDAFVQVQ